jgi:tRNA(fMet)-specific endonuclease VapC
MVMIQILIDTNIYTYALKGDAEVVSILQKASKIGISSISIGELFSGFKGGSKEGENRKELETFLDSPRVFICNIDYNTAEYYAEILNQLKVIGRPIPTNDIWIAATAFQYGLKLCSKDSHFKDVPGLILV